MMNISKRLIAIISLFLALTMLLSCTAKNVSSPEDGATVDNNVSSPDNGTYDYSTSEEGILMSWQSDNMDGTYTNPILWGDYPDPDVIRVGDTFYFMSTSMEYMPGCPILKSKDLVNWEPAGYALPRLDASPRYNLENCGAYGTDEPWTDRGGDIYGSGPWATSLRYHDGKFYALFACNDLNTSFICIADDPAGPWETYDLQTMLYDPSMLFDDDGRVYVICGQTNINLYELSKDCKSVIDGPIPLYSGTFGTEGNRAYKINGYYYILNVGFAPEICHRSKDIRGPYEEKAIYEDPMFIGVPHQGCLVDTPTGEWWGMIFQDRGALGRVPLLMPVTWVDGWPMYGPKGKGEGVITYRKPNVGAVYPVKVPETTDYFDKTTLGLQWQWNHNPDDDYWSLSERPGYLRLKAAKQVRDIYDIYSARNTLLQRIEGPGCIGTTEMDTSGMKDGDVAGLCVFQKPYAYVAVYKHDGKKDIIMVNGNKTIETIPDFKGDIIWFRAESIPYAEKAVFYYSTDNITWNRIGNELHMKYNLEVFEGNRFGLMCYTTGELGGYADFNWFKYYNETLAANRFSAYRNIEIERFDERDGPYVYPSKHENPGIDHYVRFYMVGEWVKFNNVNFYGGPKQIKVRASFSGSDDERRIIVKIDDPVNGKTIATCPIKNTHGEQAWQEFVGDASGVTGRHSIYVMALDGTIFVNSFEFVPVDSYDATLKIDGSPISVDGLEGGKIEVVSAGDGYFALKSKLSGKYMCVDPKTRKLSFSADEISEFEKFLFIDVGQKTIALVGHNYEYVSMRDGALWLDKNEVGKTEKFELEY